MTAAVVPDVVGAAANALVPLADHARHWLAAGGGHVAVPAADRAIASPRIRYVGVLPFIVLLGGAVALLGLGSLVRRSLRPALATGATVAVAGTALGLSLWQWFDVTSRGAYTTIDKAVVVDGFSAAVAVTTCVAVLLTALASDGYLRREGVAGVEYHVLVLVSASGAVLMGQANDLVVVFLGLEILSIALYVLAAFNARRAASGEAAMKYFILGAFSSAIFVYGIALTYGATGSINLLQIADFLSRNVVVHDGTLLAGLSLLLVGFCFKVAAVPFHMWSPDVYEGSPSPVVGFMAAVAKVGAFAALLRVFVSTFGVLGADWRPVVYVIAIATLVVGAVLALVQRDIKRMLAYSSINHAGFVLLGLQAATAKGVSGAVYYLFAYTVMVVGTFAVVTVLGRTGDVHHDIAGYRGLAQRQPFLALSLAVLLLAQAGAPFTTGFLAKFEVVSAAVDAHSVPLALVAMVSAGLAAFFYLRVAVLMYSAPAGSSPADPSGAAGAWTALRVIPALAGAGAGTDAPLWAGLAGPSAALDRLNDEVLLEGGADGSTARSTAGAAGDETDAGETDAGETGQLDEQAVPVPPLAALAVGLAVAVTVGFGVIPGPLTDFAHAARFLFGG